MANGPLGFLIRYNLCHKTSDAYIFFPKRITVDDPSPPLPYTSGPDILFLALRKKLRNLICETLIYIAVGLQ